jgi:hypothetical protein
MSLVLLPAKARKLALVSASVLEQIDGQVPNLPKTEDGRWRCHHWTRLRAEERQDSDRPSRLQICGLGSAACRATELRPPPAAAGGARLAGLAAPGPRASEHWQGQAHWHWHWQAACPGPGNLG